MFNSHGTSWQQTAKIVFNADNGGKEHESSKIAQWTPRKFNDESFGAMKFFQKKFFDGNITGNEPKIDQK